MPKYGVHGFLLEGWRATVTAVRQAAGPDVVAIGFFGQMHGCLMR